MDVYPIHISNAKNILKKQYLGEEIPYYPSLPMIVKVVSSGHSSYPKIQLTENTEYFWFHQLKIRPILEIQDVLFLQTQVYHQQEIFMIYDYIYAMFPYYKRFKMKPLPSLLHQLTANHTVLTLNTSQPDHIQTMLADNPKYYRLTHEYIRIPIDEKDVLLYKHWYQIRNFTELVDWEIFPLNKHDAKLYY